MLKKIFLILLYDVEPQTLIKFTCKRLETSKKMWCYRRIPKTKANECFRERKRNFKWRENTEIQLYLWYYKRWGINDTEVNYLRWDQGKKTRKSADNTGTKHKPMNWSVLRGKYQQRQQRPSRIKGLKEEIYFMHLALRLMRNGRWFDSKIIGNN